MTSCIISPMMCRSPCVRVISSIDNFDALTFLCDPVRSAGCWCFNCVDAVCGYVPPSSSSTSYPCEGDIWPSRTFAATSCATTTTFSYLVVVCATSRITCTFDAATSFLLFSANYVMHSLALSLFLSATDFYLCDVWSALL